MNSYRSFHSDTANATEQCLVNATEQSGNDVTEQSGNALSMLVNDDVGCKVDHILRTLTLPESFLSRKKKIKVKNCMFVRHWIRSSTEGCNRHRFTTNRFTNFFSPNKESTATEVGFLLPL